MNPSPSNPFVLPGFGQSGDAATNPLLASLEMMRKAFADLGAPAGMSAGLGLSPPMNPEELERKIAELKSVENWLKLNLSMLSSTIQGMEVQLATIATLKSFMAAGSAGSANAQATQGDAATTAAAPAAQAWWDMLQQQFGQVAAATAASMALKPTPAAGQAPAKRASAAKKTARKTTTKKTS
ncbi:MAG: transcriptional regulator [Burkholderiaceae bacterium]|nr:transcriptional regulator [Burkholderiaceae bacterium]